MSPRFPIRLLAAQSDDRLVSLVHDGHERAFEALVHRYRRALLRYCRRMGLADSRAEDVVQQAFLRAWLALARGTEVREVKPWLYRIAHNAALNSLRASSTERSALGEIAQIEASRGAGSTLAAGDTDLDTRIAAREALAGVAALPAMQRDAIVLTAVAGQSHEEAANVLGISDGAVRGLLYRARTTLRSAAAAITPQWLLEWAYGGAGAAAPSAERMAELAAGSGAVGVTGVMLKGAVAAVTAGVIAGGAAVGHVHRHHAAQHAGGSATVASATAGAASDAATAPTPAQQRLAEVHSGGRHVDGARRSLGALHHRGRRGGDRHGRGSSGREERSEQQLVVSVWNHGPIPLGFDGDDTAHDLDRGSRHGGRHTPPRGGGAIEITGDGSSGASSSATSGGSDHDEADIQVGTEDVRVRTGDGSSGGRSGDHPHRSGS